MLLSKSSKSFEFATPYATPSATLARVSLIVPNHSPDAVPPAFPPTTGTEGDGDRARAGENYLDERFHDVHVGGWHSHLQHHDYVHGDHESR